MVAHNIGSSFGTRDIGAVSATASSGGSITATGAISGLIGAALAVAAVTVSASAAATGLMGSASSAAVQTVTSTGSTTGLLGSASSAATQSPSSTGNATGLIGSADSTSTQTLPAVAVTSGSAGSTSAASTQSIPGAASGAGSAGSASSASAQSIPGAASGGGLAGTASSSSTQVSSAAAGASGLVGSGSSTTIQTVIAVGSTAAPAGSASAVGGDVSNDIDATASVGGLLGSASSISTQSVTSAAVAAGPAGLASSTVLFPAIYGAGDASGPAGAATAASTQAITASSAAVGIAGVSSCSSSQSIPGAGAASGPDGSAASTAYQIVTSGVSASGSMGSASAASTRTINASAEAVGLTGSASATAFIDNPEIRDGVESVHSLDNAMWADAKAYASSNGLRSNRSSEGAFNPHQSDCVVWSFEPRSRNRLTRGKVEHGGVATATVFIHAGKGPIEALRHAQGLKDALGGKIYGAGESMAEVQIDPLERQGASFTVKVVVPWKLCQNYTTGGQITPALQSQPDMVECYTEIRKAWRDYVQPGLPGVSAYFDNAPTEEVDMPLCMNMISTLPPFAIEMGTLRTEGRVICALHFPPGTGFSALWDAIDVIVEAFDSKTYGNIKFKTPVIGRTGRSDINSWQASIRLPFHFEVNDL